MGPLAHIDLSALVWFSCAAFVATSGAVVLSAFLPRNAGPAGGRGAAGALLLCVATLALGALIVVIVIAAMRLPPAVAVVAAGLAFLCAPLAVQVLPEVWRESRAGLVAVVALSIAALLSPPSPFVL